MTIYLRILTVLTWLLVSSSAWADWRLQPDLSSLNFISVKKDSIGEVHKFTELSGLLKSSGSFEFSVDLKSVDTGIEIRDQRMQEHLFDVAKFPIAKVVGVVDPAVLKKLKTGQPYPIDVELTINLHGISINKSAELIIVKLSRKQLWVVTSKPLIINAKEFELSSGIEKLKQLAGLPSIAEAVPVNVQLMFKQN